MEDSSYITENEMLVTCSICHSIRHGKEIPKEDFRNAQERYVDEKWMHPTTPQYSILEERFQLSHGYCPPCLDNFRQKIMNHRAKERELQNRESQT